MIHEWTSVRRAVTNLVLFGLCVVITGGCAMTRGVSQSRIRQMRKEIAHRERRIIFDNDGNEPVYYLDEATPESLLACRTTPLTGSQVDTIVYCTWSSGFSMFTHDTKVGEVFTSTAEEPGKGPGSGFSRNKTKQLIEQGTDPLAIMVDHCKRNAIEVFWSMRMNDIHDAWGAWYSPHLFPQLKKDHPEWLMGTEDNRPENGAWTAVDYTRPEIRDLAFRFIEEVCTNYDIDGVQLDFFRHLTYFRRHAMGEACGREELDLMTDLLRRVRAMADKAGRKRGRPILISARVPDSVELCRAVGFDIVGWMEEDLIDLMTVSGYFRLNPWETMVELGDKYGVPVYPCLSESRVRDAEARKARASLECYRGRAVEAWASGADGIYMFNFFNPNSPLWRELGDVDTLRGLDKMYCAGVRGYGNLSFWYEGGETYMNRSLLSPDWARTLKPGEATVVDVQMDEALSQDDAPQVTVRVRFADLAAAEDVVVKLNGAVLGGGVKQDAWIGYAVEPNLVKRGTNQFEIALTPEAKAPAVLQDLLVWVRFGRS